MNPGTVYAGTEGEGMFKTTDGGGSWAPMNSGLPAGDVELFALAIDPTSPRTIYAGTAPINVGGEPHPTDRAHLADADLLVAADAGAHWLADQGLTPDLIGGTPGIQPGSKRSPGLRPAGSAQATTQPAS